HNTKCKVCVLERGRRLNRPPLTKEERKKRALRYKYGITIEKYTEMLLEQKGVCAICGLPETRVSNNGNIKVLSVDHCHETGKVRGLLCQRCNSGIGFLNDDIENLKCAILYLNKED
ncbi:hypothetical protein LCGC14_2231970, partial [marine sediment metagenome]